VTEQRPDEAAPGADAAEAPAGGGADAARAALARARAAAAAKGLRPGSPARPGARRRRGDAPRSGSGPDDRDPQPFGRTIARLLTERAWTTPVAVGGVMGRWDQIVGEEVAAHCRPETFSDRVLTVRTDSTAWATQVRLLGPSVLARLADELGAGVVTRLVVKGPSGPSWKRGPRTAHGGRGPRDTYG
jgi:predicted nucleic acid-binding Zn ribbon protein